MINYSAKEKITRARISILLDSSLAFFSSLMMKKPMVVDNTIGTACTNGKVIKYSEKYIEEIDQDEIKFLICHELMHITGLHHTRREGRDPEMWNKAADYAINPILIKSGLKMHKRWLYEKRFEDMSAETIYRILQQEQQDKESSKPEPQDDQGEDNSPEDDQSSQPEPDQQESPENDPQDDQQESSDNTQQDDAGEDGEDEGQGDQQDAQGDDGDAEGDGGDGIPSEDERGQESPQNEPQSMDFGQGGVEDAPATSDAELEQAEAEAKQELAAAIQIAKQQGELPAYLEKMVGEMLQPRIPWQEVLSRFISDTSKSDYSFMKPNRRFSNSRLVMPSLYKEEVGGIVLVIDTSISVFSQIKLLNRFASEMQEVCSMMRSPITVIHVDTAVKGEPDIIEPDDTFNLVPRGGGGTDFRPPFEWLEENEVDVKCLIYFTDMECSSFPSEEPAYPVLWARYGSDRRVPPFGEVIQVDGYRSDDDN